jgi:hypothetical protein
MAHRCGFTLNVLLATLQNAGFTKVVGNRRPQAFDLWGLATVSEIEDELIRIKAAQYFA